MVVVTRFRARTGRWTSLVERSPDRLLGVGESGSNTCFPSAEGMDAIDGMGGVRDLAEELNFGPFCSGVSQKSAGWELAVDDKEDGVVDEEDIVDDGEDGVVGDDSRRWSLPNSAGEDVDAKV